MLIALNIVLSILLIYLLFANGYTFFYALMATLSGNTVYKKTEGKQRRVAVFIPAYKEDAVILSIAQKALEQDYPEQRYTVAVIADSLQDSTLEKLRALPIETVEVSFEKSTKSKALRAGMKHLGMKYDIAVILDADNIMAPDFLSQVNAAFEKGFRVVQGHRTAKNLNSSYALMDAASEEIANSIFRKGHRAMGFSSALIGSGMAFEYRLFHDFMRDVHAVGGFDKELELKLARDGVIIEYLGKAYVYDEKVANKDVFENQRRRWFSAQLVYFRRFFGNALLALLSRGNVNYFDKAIQMILPPRGLALGVTGLMWLISLLLWWRDWRPEALPALQLDIWTICWGFLILGLLLALPRRMYNRSMLRAVMALPGAIWATFLLLFRLKGANKKFIHTQHQASDEDLPKL